MDLQLPGILAANDAYRSAGFNGNGRTPEPARRLVLLTCMDVRLDLFDALGLAIGDAHVLRNAGGRTSPDVLRSLIVSAHVLGTRELGVLHHTKCGLQGVSEAELTQRTGVAGVDFLAFADLEESVRADVTTIRTSGVLPDDFTVWGGVYDVDSREIRLVVTP